MKGSAEWRNGATEVRKSSIIEVRMQPAGQEWGERRAAAFLLIAGGSQATLAVPLLGWCYTGTGGREATHSLDLSLITAYLVVNNSTSAETHGRDEDDRRLPRPLRTSLWFRSTAAWLCCLGAMRTYGGKCSAFSTLFTTGCKFTLPWHKMHWCKFFFFFF